VTTSADIFPDTISGANTGSIYIQDAQLESGLVASSYLESTSVTGKAGVLVDLPRINYDANGQNGALLLEPSRANGIPYSEYFNGWTAINNVSITDNSTTSPEGVVNASLMSVSGAGSLTRSIRVGSQSTTTDKKTMSVFAKANTGNTIQLYHSGEVQGYVNFDLSSGEVGTSGTNTTGDIEPIGNDWYRCIATFDSVGNFGSSVYVGFAASSSAPYGGGAISDTSLSVYIFGAQYELGSYVSSYIPTMGTSETRAADSCSVTGVSDVIGQTEGTLYWELEKIVDGFDYYQVSDGGTNNWILVGIDSGNVLAYIKTGGAVQVSTGSPMSVGRHKIALAYAANDVVLYLDGVQVGSDTSVSIPATNEIALSQGNPAGAKGISTKTFQCALFNERLSNAELAALTA
jgi:hypothetical protein